MRSLRHERVRRILVAWTWVALGALGPEPARAQGVSVALSPSTLMVAPDSVFTIALDVRQVGSPFNTFDTVIAFEPTALTFLPTSPPKLQEGCLLNGICSNACGNTFNLVTASADSVWVVDGLLCASTQIQGPGELYHLRFRAGHTPRTTFVRLRSFFAYNAGLYVNPIATADALIGIGMPLGVGPTSSPGSALTVQAKPNPARSTVAFAVQASDRSDQPLEVHDISGRLIRVVARERSATGAETLFWDGLDATGSRVPPGLYLATLRAGTRVTTARFVLLQ